LVTIARVIILLCTTGSIICGAMRSHVRFFDWRTEEALFSSAVHVQPASARAHYNLGSAIIATSRGDQAIEDDSAETDIRRALVSFLRTLVIDPTYDEAWNNVGATYESLGQHDRAATAYYALSALRGGQDPYAVNAIGRASAAQGKIPEAEVYFQTAITLGDEQGQCQSHALYNLGKLRATAPSAASPPQGDQGALQLYMAAAACDPQYRGAREAAGAALHTARRSKEAVQHFEAVVELLGKDTSSDRARALANLGGVLAVAGRVRSLATRNSFQIQLIPLHFYSNTK
jgi:tetratricopeptide (TPR) repeat protein